MAQSAPPVDQRTMSDVAAELHSGLAAAHPGWPAVPPPQGAAMALVQVAARYAGLVIDRINRVPDRNRVAFLSYLGGSLLPPQPARVPLTFALAPGSVTAAVVPAGTQVAAAPAPGVTTPVVFETDSELVVTAAQLDQLFVRSPDQDRYSDLSTLLMQHSVHAAQVYAADTQIEHSLCIGDAAFFGAQALNTLTISFDLEEGAAHTQQSAFWEIVSSQGQPVPLTPYNDDTHGMTQSGDVTFHDVPAFALARINDRQAYWLRCRLLKPLLRPIIARSLTMERVLEQGGLLPATAYSGTTALDLGKDFLPFGSKPKFGDTFYLSIEPAFSLPGAQLTLSVVVTNTSAETIQVPVPRVYTAGRARVTWEYWDGIVWRELGTMTTDEEVHNDATLFSDTTRAFTLSGNISFRIPDDMQPVELGDASAMRIRARLSANHYGEEAGYTAKETKPGVHEYIFRPATLSPPFLKKIEAGFVLHQLAQQPDTVLTYNDFTYQDVTAGLRGSMQNAELFSLCADDEPALYFGFQPPSGLSMPTLPVTISFVFAPGGQTIAPAEEKTLQRIAWQFWSGRTWETFNVVDRTGAFAYSGAISFLVPAGAQSREEFGLLRYWLRVPWRGGSKDRTAPLRMVLLNTVSASQCITLTNEIVSSSTGAPDQVVHSALRPVLDDELLEVRAVVRSTGQKDAEVWTPWQNVPDFHASGPLDRHYVLDRLAGDFTFGDGQQGAIPPQGSANIRLTRYRTGGGTGGNKGPDTIVQLKTTVPYVKSVTNPEAATGGADAETLEHLLARAPKSFRHRARAVTIEDYEDLAMLASPAVARARCLPLANLLLDPDAKQTRPGVVSLIIVPRDLGGRPMPGQALLATVHAYLRERQSATVELVVLAPEYVELDLDVELGVKTLEGMMELESSVRAQLASFTDTLSGGFDHTGWDFGRQPNRSDLLTLLGAIEGVDHVRMLHLSPRECRQGALKTNRFLVCAGKLTITFTLV